MALEHRVLELVEDDLRRRGLAATTSRASQGYVVELTGGLKMFLGNLTDRLARLDEDEWPAQVAHFVEAGLALPRSSGPLDEAETRARIRTRLIPDDPDVPTPCTYARPFAPGIRCVLALDFELAVQTVTDATLADLPLPLDELYRIGQANTDAEPIDDTGTVSEHVSALGGRSPFVASKAGNLAALVPDVIGEAPCGLLFAVPDRHLLLYTVLASAAEDQMVQFVAFTQTVDALDDDAFETISPAAYYWAPDGTIERVTSHLIVEDEPASVITWPASLQRSLP